MIFQLVDLTGSRGVEDVRDVTNSAIVSHLVCKENSNLELSNFIFAEVKLLEVYQVV